jgi:hypothetical protein
VHKWQEFTLKGLNHETEFKYLDNMNIYWSKEEPVLVFLRFKGARV